ncbi:MAG: hypothetical protein CME36_17230 [unclassified Hahellaceae]|nr:hypothetical protein [Hahellaceae bacterium]|tara:strand:+ start:33754 stop:34272 length:519 start_codon:yes stop_codon:yes gene_type:complete
MKRFPVTAALAKFRLIVSVLLLIAAGKAVAHGASEAGLTISHAWTRSVPVAGLNGAGYVTISNSGEQAYRLVAVETEVAAQTSLHESVTSEAGMMSMKPLPEGVLIPPGATVELAPGAVHIMFMKLVSPTTAGERLPATFVFEPSEVSGQTPIRLDSWFAVQPVSGESHAHH